MRKEAKGKGRGKGRKGKKQDFVSLCLFLTNRHLMKLMRPSTFEGFSSMKVRSARKGARKGMQGMLDAVSFRVAR